MKSKIEMPLEIELQLLELGINIMEVMHDIEALLEGEEVFSSASSTELFH